MATIKRSPLPSLEDAQHEVETRPFTTAPVVAVVYGISLGMAYAALAEGSIASVRVGSKHRIPTAQIREAMAARASVPPDHMVAA